MEKSTMNRREFLRLSILAAAGSAVLTACAPAAPAAQPTQAPAAEATQAPEATAVPATAAPAEAGKGVKVTFWWHHGGDIGNSIENANKTFMEKNTDISIEGLQISDLGSKLKPALSGGVGPDIWDSGLPDAIQGYVQPLDEYVKASGKINIDEYPQKPEMIWEGKLYNIPAIESGMENALVWNKKMFEAAGLDPEKPPTTLAELLSMAEKLTKVDSSGNILELGFDDRDSSGGMYPNWQTAFAIEVFDAANKKMNFSQPEHIQMVDWMVAYEKKMGPEKIGAFHKSYPGWGSVTPGGAFCTGKEAMMIDGSWCPGGLAKLAPDGDFGYTWVPGFNSPNKTQQMGAHALAINAVSKVAQQAYKLVEFMCTEGNDIIYNQSGSFAYYKSWAAKADTSKFKGLKFYFDSVAEATFIRPRGYVLTGWGEWWAAIDDLVLGKQSDTKTALAQAEEEAQKAFDDLLSQAQG